MGVIIPAILPKTRHDLESKLAAVRGVAESVQIDVIDGHFASPACWPYGAGAKEFAQMAKRNEMLPGFGSMSFDIDLMVRDPEAMAGTWIEMGASRITIHAESTPKLASVLSDLAMKYGHQKDFNTGLLSIGLAIGLDTDVAIIEQFLPSIDYVQFMGIRTIGRQGEPFDNRVIERVKRFRHAHPEMPVQVDGGVTKLTAPALLSAGVTRLIVGHAIFQTADPVAEYRAFAELALQYGTYE